MSKKKPRERLANLEHLLRHGGSYLIGDTKSIQGVAIASDAEVVYAALMRGEIAPINEVPGGRFYVGRKRRAAAGKP